MKSELDIPCFRSWIVYYPNSKKFYYCSKGAGSVLILDDFSYCEAIIVSLSL